jgi:hypothetical protein
MYIILIRLFLLKPSCRLSMFAKDKIILQFCSAEAKLFRGHASGYSLIQTCHSEPQRFKMLQNNAAVFSVS